MNATRFWIGLLAAAPVIGWASLALGPSGVGFPDPGTPAGAALLTLRAERLWAGLVVGSALAGAGTLFQALLRNPLAEPYVLGVSGGSALGAAVVLLAGAATVWSLPLAAFAAGAATLLLVVALAGRGTGGPSLYGLLLSGVIVSSVCSGLLMFLLSIGCTVLIAVGLGACATLAPEWNALTLGREAAHHVGVRTGAAVAAGLGLATLLTASAVATAGLIGFVGLVVPHVARSLVGPDHRRLVPAAAAAGGLFLAISDTLARTILAPREIPVGVITALAGGPFFLWILRQRGRRGWTP